MKAAPEDEVVTVIGTVAGGVPVPNVAIRLFPE
jgi:hypothetical protein